jgi:hypothetical protein
MDEKQKVTNDKMVKHHAGLWTLKVQSFFALFLLCLFCWLTNCVFLCFVFHGSGVTNLNSMMEWVICYGYYIYLMEMCIMLHEGDWWGVSTPSMEGAPRTWISGSSHGGDAPFFLRN